MKQFLLVTVAACVFSANAFADETIKYRGAFHMTAAQSQEVGDGEAHVLSLLKGQGLSLLPEGGAAQTTFTSITDYNHGDGPFTVYFETAFADGSMLYYRGDGQATVKGTVTALKIPLTIIGGKGRYAGAKGDGMVTGIRYQPLPGAGAEIATEATLNIKK
jgi:hypothetical protein